MATPEGMITVQEAARRLGRSIEQVRRYLREGKLPGQRIGQQWFIDEGALEAPYRQTGGDLGRIREAVATMEVRPVKADTGAGKKRLLSADLIARIDRLGGAIARERGAIDVVALVRRSREEH